MPPPGATEIASVNPSGDQCTLPTGSSSMVTGVGHPPAAGTVHAWGRPPRLHRKARLLPSGEKLGALQAPILLIDATAARRSAGEDGLVLPCAAMRPNGSTRT